LQAVVFDWDGTLVDSESLNLATWASQLTAFGYTPSRAELAQLPGRTFPDCLRYFAPRIAGDVAAFEQEWRAEIDRRVRAGLVTFADSVACLKAVQAAGILVAVATQTPRRQLELGLAVSGLAGLVTVSVCRDDVERPKPAPDVYLEACARLHVPATDCLAVEDSPVGAQSARTAGLAVLGVARAGATPSALTAVADLVVDELVEDFLLDLLLVSPPAARNGERANARSRRCPMASTPTPDVFISYNSADALIAQEIARELDRAGLRCWLDLWSLVPGRPWQEDTEAALAACQTVVVAIGRSGFGPWHLEELRSALALRVEGAGERRVVPVLLPGATPEIIAGLPPFLRRLAWVDLRHGMGQPAMSRLAAGCRGEAVGMVASGASTTLQLEPVVPAGSAAEQRMLAFVEASIRAVRRWARAIQNEDGGFPSDKEGTYSCTWSSAGLLWSMAMAGEDFHGRWMRRALAWVLDSRNSDGGSPIVAVGDPSITEATAQSALACVAAYEQTGDPRLGREASTLIDWLLYRQETSAGWCWRPGRESSWTVPTAFAMLALAAAARSPVGASADIHAALDQAVDWVVANRNADCGWGSFPSDESRPAVTGLMMYALAELGRRELARESLDFLYLAQQENGHWPAAIDRPSGRSVIRFGAAYGVLGVARCVDGITSPSLQSGVHALMASFTGRHFRYPDSIIQSWPTRDGLLALSAVAALGTRILPHR
jgi:beta-phosphoglucomutase-like phosphatase (HAD superfamily)/prenyltransferase beta subunit